MEERKKWTALYLPASGDDSEDPSAQFDTEEEGWEYVYNSMCSRCKQEQALALRGESWEDTGSGSDYHCPPDEFPPCASEWDVCLTEELEDL